MNLREFSQRIGIIGTTVAENSEKLVRKVGLAVDASVVIATPVDTGRARSNWLVRLDVPTDATIAAYFPGKEKSTAGVNAAAAIDQGKATIAGYRTGQTIHITNNLKYIGRLNNGYSAQAPAAFVEQAVQAGSQAFEGVKLTVEGGVQ